MGSRCGFYVGPSCRRPSLVARRFLIFKMLHAVCKQVSENTLVTPQVNQIFFYNTTCATLFAGCLPFNKSSFTSGLVAFNQQAVTSDHG